MTWSPRVTDVIGIAWQHDGLFFKARLLFDCWLISGTTPTIEPAVSIGEANSFAAKKKGPNRGEGFYPDPRNNGWVLAAGRPAIINMMRYFAGRDPAKLRKVLDRSVITDDLKRPCVLFYLDAKPGGRPPVLKISKPALKLPEGWVGDVAPTRQNKE